MPREALCPCKQSPRCAKFAEPGHPYCKDHAHLEIDERPYRDRSDDASRKIRNSRQWTDITRPYILARDPLCKIGKLCEGKAPSVEVDHIVPVNAGGDPWDTNNLQGACKQCHSYKTRKIDMPLIANKMRG
jgi:5-methylcytosine-specific restriction enzyme A